MDRLLFSTVDNGNYNAGHVVGYVIGLIYMLAFVYYIYRKYLNILFEDLLGILEKDHDDYFYKPIVFSLLNSIQFLILCFFSAFISKSNLGVATVIGSDAFSLLFVIPVIIMRFKDMNHGNQDAWTLLRDMTLYVGCLIMILFFIYFNVPEIISSILLLVYYLINLFVLSQNQEIKEKLMEWLNLNNEDNEFNSDEHFTYKKRRNSLSQLIQQNCIDYEDKNLIKRLNRVEVQLTLQYKDAQDLPKKKRAQLFQRAVYVIVFAIRKNSQNERIQRTQYYQNLYKPKNARVNIPPLNTQMHNIVKEKPQQDNLMVQNPNDDREEQPFNSNPMDSVKNNEQEPNTQGQENINLNMPDNLLDKILFIIFYPIHLILYLLPNYINEVGPKKLVLCLFSNICLLVGCSFCIDWWTYEFSMATTIPIQIMGLVVIGSAIQIQFYQYQMEVARKVQSPEFVSCFTQTALCKISFCVGLPWLFTVLGEFNIDPSNITKYSQAFAISIAVYVGLLFLFVLQCFLRRFKILQEDGVIMLCYYFGFLLTSIIIISLNILS